MATFLDITLLQQFSAVFSFLLVFAIVYALFQSTKMLGDNKGLHAMIAFAMGMFVLFTPQANVLIAMMSPWFVILFLIGVFTLMAIKMLGVNDADIKGAVTSLEHRYIIYFVVIFCVVIVLFAFSQSFGQSVGPFLDGESEPTTSGSAFLNASDGGIQSTNTGDFNQNLAATIFHPKVLGMIVLLIIASFSIRLLASK